ncbi:hypothetical protein A2837_00945 [Candidatus Kaiserbacteria bacterium RIFCSPHIGHO2_01_FULL_46_22]|uniref:Thioredoxin domain-containing protein n=1 Tax=Candidatus Kaiserbacteria bacterium RIFCSPHIGHO2_01_FULL_46_22 TaxID=1798475 RepID=A0A1F6BYY1_9BACT|nr:MAG: hypothetical protein A2837_00945 [Candidatus Kaiserbacteria bacterium RIFCSPHIGHO2_01_FULL_46_22]
MYYSKQASEKANEGVTISSHIKGNPEARVELVEYSDFQCPACAQFYPYVKDLLDEHGSSIRFEYRHFPLVTVHPVAIPAARAAEAASQQGKFWEMHDKLFENQSAWSKASNANALFVQYAEELDLDVSLFKSHMNASLIDEAISKSFEDARTRGFSGTPTFLLNGELMQFTTFDEFRTAIEEAIAEAS